MLYWKMLVTVKLLILWFYAHSKHRNFLFFFNFKKHVCEKFHFVLNTCIDVVYWYMCGLVVIINFYSIEITHYTLWCKLVYWQTTHTHTHTHTFNGPFSWTTRVGWYQKGKTNLDFTIRYDTIRDAILTCARKPT